MQYSNTLIAKNSVPYDMTLACEVNFGSSYNLNYLFDDKNVNFSFTPTIRFFICTSLT